MSGDALASITEAVNWFFNTAASIGNIQHLAYVWMDALMVCFGALIARPVGSGIRRGYSAAKVGTAVAPTSTDAFLDRAIATEAAEIGEMFQKDDVLELLETASRALGMAVAKYNAVARPSFSQANRTYMALLGVIKSYKKEG